MSFDPAGDWTPDEALRIAEARTNRATDKTQRTACAHDWRIAVFPTYAAWYCTKCRLVERMEAAQ